MKIKKYTIVNLFVLIFFLCFLAVPVFANTIVPSEGKSPGSYDANDLILVLVNISAWVLRLSGSMALLGFIYGGFMFILSGGSSDKVNTGKQALMASVVGLIVVLLAYTAIDFFMSSLGFQSGGAFGNWYRS